MEFGGPPLERRILWDTRQHFPFPLELLQILGGFPCFYIWGAAHVPPCWEVCALGGGKERGGKGIPVSGKTLLQGKGKAPDRGEVRGQEQPSKTTRRVPGLPPILVGGGVLVPHHRLLQGAREMSLHPPSFLCPEPPFWACRSFGRDPNFGDLLQ